jgi:hypothetical protein
MAKKVKHRFCLGEFVTYKNLDCINITTAQWFFEIKDLHSITNGRYAYLLAPVGQAKPTIVATANELEKISSKRQKILRLLYSK